MNTKTENNIPINLKRRYFYTKIIQNLILCFLSINYINTATAVDKINFKNAQNDKIPQGILSKSTNFVAIKKNDTTKDKNKDGIAKNPLHNKKTPNKPVNGNIGKNSNIAKFSNNSVAHDEYKYAIIPDIMKYASNTTKSKNINVANDFKSLEDHNDKDLYIQKTNDTNKEQNINKNIIIPKIGKFLDNSSNNNDDNDVSNIEQNEFPIFPKFFQTTDDTIIKNDTNTVIPPAESSDNGVEKDNISPPATTESKESTESTGKSDEKAIREAKLLAAKNEITKIVGNNKLLFKDKLINIYEQNNFALLWQDKNVSKELLRQYFYFAISGISPSALTKFQQVFNLYFSNNQNQMQVDILLSDLFLDYLHYTKETNQNWMYGRIKYKNVLPSNAIINSWIKSVKDNSLKSFVGRLNHNTKEYNKYRDKINALIREKKDINSIKLLSLNMQRSRLIPEFKNAVFINIPTYYMYYYDRDNLAFESKVVVGDKVTPTPVLTSPIKSVVVNPPWTPPISIIQKELLPKLREDPNYVYHRGYNIIDAKGNVVDPYSIDWEKSGFNYRLKQISDTSALGKYKFDMINNQAIYLHDTPTRKTFTKDNRAVSHGCVRIEFAEKYAILLLGKNGMSQNEILNIKNQGKTKHIALKNNVLVHLYYITAWINKNGNISNAADIYNLDGNLLKSKELKNLELYNFLYKLIK